MDTIPLAFNFNDGYGTFTVWAEVPEDTFEAGWFNPMRYAVQCLPASIVVGLNVPTFLEYRLDPEMVTWKEAMNLEGDTFSFLFFADSIHLRLQDGDGVYLDSTNWYGYDGEMGDDGAGNNEDDEDSDEDDDTVSA